MTDILVYVPNSGKHAAEVLTLARTLGDVSAVAFDDASASLAGEYGAAKVYRVEAPGIDDYFVDPKATVLTDLARKVAPDYFLLPSTDEGKALAARTAVALDNGLMTDLSGLAPDGTATQDAFAGTTIVTAKATKGFTLATIKLGATEPAPAPSSPEVETVNATVAESDQRVKVAQRVDEPAGDRPALSEARIVVSGGRGVGSAEDFALIERVADALGGAVGASRAATDAGYYPHKFQVGQTGTTVSPQLYVAAGISGAIQHRAGMQTSRVIVAVNKDADAPIFGMADFGVVGDLFQVLPQALEEIEKRK
ncbi:electron transfer flavoprotein subunit alpha/FixB family protein [Glycomyces albidus]|jgi:electron transfer flavoprotein alpha subunit|uniref:Electron transfer flavoprotein subunit alpha/FixB family protein n=1 Tax=Glycomyces albidus TaxID=2656774 RepID=A0A6L5GAA4_9ACTN|nr:electron transfer flavoprotein subunit alpha/FixB family protein [Glycomyces albidus]MQM26528.1 electron transfer flavoprotein subunit alpha/FixB family protein [Glycomyces albidus]